MTILKEIINKNNKKKLFIFPNKKYLSYKQFYNQALNFAKNYESRLNKTKNKTVFLRMDRSIDFYIAVIGLAFLKAIIIPISNKLSKGEILAFRKMYQPDLEIDSISITKKNIKNLKIDKDFLKKAKIVFFTSGTTDDPKGVLHNFHNLFKSSNEFANLAGYKNNDIIIHNWSQYHMAGFFNMFLCPFVKGSSIFFDDEIGVDSYLGYWDILKKNKITLSYLSPTMAQALISFSNYKKEKLNLIKTKFFSTGSFLYKSTASRFKREFDVDLIDCYGVTEVGGSFALSSKSSFEDKLSKISRGIKIKLSRNNEICIKSKFMFEGYFEKYSKVKKYKHSYFKSGDLGKIQKGKYSITGRLKEIIKKGGEPVSLLHIEDITLKHEGVKDVLAKGVTSEFWGEDIELDVIFSVSPDKLNQDNKINFLKRYLGQNLPRIQMPRKINSVTHIPKTSIGKNYRRYFN